MKFEKLGRLFTPDNYDCIGEFAQSPQLLEYPDFVRIFFSTRYRDKENKYISYVAYVDMNKELDTVFEVSNFEIINKGNLGCYDEHGIFPFNVIRSDNIIMGFIGGWSRRVSVDVETSIGLSVSYDDGRTFKRIGDGPVLSSTLDEPFMVGDPFVLKSVGGYDMWYIYGTKWILNPKNNVYERVYKIGHAKSIDAVNWIKTNRQLIPDVLGVNECQALPTVIYNNNLYHMIYCYREAFDFRENNGAGYRLGYATSLDGFNWNRKDKELILEGQELEWECNMKCYPHLNRINGEVFLFYNGNEFGKNGFGVAKLKC